MKIAIVAIVVAAVVTIYVSVQASHRSLDKVTLCPAKPTSVTVLLVDVTDPMNTPQRQDFMNQLSRLENSIPRYGELIVSKVDPTDANLLKPIITRCNPGTASDVSEATGDPAAVQRQWTEGFDKPLQATFDRLATASGADKSPILESIQSVALTEFQKPGRENVPRRLIVASDLLQNTGGISFYRGLPDPTEFTSSPSFRRARTDLRGVDVELWMLERSDAASTQPQALADLWDRIVTEQGGDLKRIYNVSG
ncbi:MAG: hypothetical protein E6Q67_07550 [Roseateles sp.]|nr:MAG: hypothetical protein E6Q67_07550 [Roseateles sp.]